MVEEVIWLQRARKSFSDIIKYLKSEWTYDTAVEFHNRTMLIIDLIREFPEIGILTKRRENLRKFLITKHNYIIYRIFRNKLIIIDIADTRKK